MTLTDATHGAVIYYSIGTPPTASSTLYTGPITVSASEIIEAIAIAPGYANSKEVSGSYQIENTTATLNISGSNPNLTLKCSVTGPPAPLGLPGPTGNVTFSDTTTGQSIGTVSLGAAQSTNADQFISSPVGSQPSAVTSGDFNGDGIVDMAVANKADSTVSILLGNGDGTFQPQIVYSVGASPTLIAAADFNGDHKLDLALWSYDTGDVTILLGNGDGTFTAAPASLQVTFAAQVMVVGDFNGDGNEDLAFLFGPNLAISFGNGNGTFQAPKASVIVGANAFFSAMSAADLNGDGKSDLVLQQQQGSYSRPAASFMFLLSNGDGTFQVQAITASEQLPFEPHTFALADVNGDGNPDLIAFEQINSGDLALLGVLLGNGDGTFQYLPELDQPFAVPGTFLPGAIAVGQFNGDKSVDVAVNDGFAALIFAGAGNGTFGSPTSVAIGSTIGLVPLNLTGSAQTVFATADANANAVSVGIPEAQDSAAAAISGVGVSAGEIANHALQCSYSGDSNYGSSSGFATLDIVTPQAPVFSLLVGEYPSAQQVSISGGAAGATYYYTTDGSDPTTSSTVYTGPITITSSVELKAIAGGPYYLSSPVSEAVYTITDPPQLSPASGTTSKPQVVTIADSTPGAAIYYTTDGSAPSTKSSKYTGPITLIKTATVKAFATAAGYIDSAISATTYSVQLPAPEITWATPASIVYGTELSAKELDARTSAAGTLTYSPKLGTILDAGAHTLTVSFTPANPDLYSPTTKTVEIEVTRRVLTVAAYSRLVLYGQPLPKLIYSITGFVDRDTVAVVKGKPVESTTAKDGSPPGIYPITIKVGTLTAANYRFEMKDGEITIKPLGALARPTFDPPGGSYAAAQTITISTKPGATIFYSVQRGATATGFIKYTEPVKVSASETVEAYAEEKGYITSAKTSAAYRIP